MKADTIVQEKSTVNIGIEQADREAVVNMLEILLADEHVLYIKLRNYHWNVMGVHFKSLHEFFEAQYTEVAGFIDEIAERIRALGFFTPASMETFRKNARLEETGHLNGNPDKMLENLLLDQEALIQILRHDVEVIMDEHNDAGTNDFLVGLMEAHEKMAWMTRAHLA